MIVEVLETPVEQRLSKAGITWEQFQAIEASFAEIPGVRLVYCQGVLEIVTISKLHEMIKSILAALLVEYLVHSDIDAFPSGSYTQSITGVVKYESDLSYCIGAEKDRPDLAVEIVLTSGGTEKLKKYQVFGVPEVWFWQNDRLLVYCLRSDGYELMNHSEILLNLDLKLVEQCVKIKSVTQAVKVFRKQLI